MDIFIIVHLPSLFLCIFIKFYQIHLLFLITHNDYNILNDLEPALSLC